MRYLICCLGVSIASMSAAAFAAEITAGGKCELTKVVRASAKAKGKGKKTKLNVPEGTQSGTVLRLRGQGVPQLGGRGRGDLHVLVRVSIPTRLTPEQRELMEKLAETLPLPDVEDKEKSLFERMRDVFG